VPKKCGLQGYPAPKLFSSLADGLLVLMTNWL